MLCGTPAGLTGHNADHLTQGRISEPFSTLLRWYYRGPDHRFKMRLWGWMRGLQRHRPFTIRYGESGRLTIDERCFLQRSIFVSGSYEPEVADALLHVASTEETVWDIGANIGSFGVLARLDQRVRDLVCFEPDPYNRAILQRNLSLNKGARYWVVPFALSDQMGQGRLLQGPPTNRGMSRLVGNDGTDTAACFVECRTIDGLVFNQQVPAPTLVKIDVEGWEHRVLLGAQRLLRDLPPKAIVFESRCEANGEMLNRRIPELLMDHGYQVTKIRRRLPGVDEQENFVALRSPDRRLQKPDQACLTPCLPAL